MFNDRDLAVLGTGAFLSVLCLLLPFSLVGKFIVGSSVLICGMVVTFARFGRDRLTLEEWLKRRGRYALRPRRWVFHITPRIRNQPHKTDQTAHASPSSSSRHVVHTPDRKRRGVDNIPRGMYVGETAAAMLLLFAGIYFLYALWIGEAADIAVLLQRVLP